MGNEDSKPEQKPITHDQIVSIINASNTKSSEHSEKTAASLEMIAYILIALVIASVLFIVYRLVSKYERMKTEARLEKAISLNNVRSTVV